MNKTTGKPPGRPVSSPDGKAKIKKGVYIHPDTAKRLESKHGSLSKALESLDKDATKQ